MKASYKIQSFLRSENNNKNFWDILNIAKVPSSPLSSLITV